MKVWPTVLSALALCAALAAASRAEEDALAGFGPVRFGMRADEVKSLFAQIEDARYDNGARYLRYPEIVSGFRSVVDILLDRDTVVGIYIRPQLGHIKATGTCLDAFDTMHRALERDYGVPTVKPEVRVKKRETYTVTKNEALFTFPDGSSIKIRGMANDTIYADFSCQVDMFYRAMTPAPVS